MLVSPTSQAAICFTRLISETTYRVSEQDISEMTDHYLNEGGQSIIVIVFLRILLWSSLKKRQLFLNLDTPLRQVFLCNK